MTSDYNCSQGQQMRDRMKNKIWNISKIFSKKIKAVCLNISLRKQFNKL